MVPVKYTENKALIYMYRPDRLQQDLKDETAGRILAQKGYPLDNTSHCVAELARRLNYGSEFPHEIGLFLGYPSEDVYGFIKEGSGNAKYVGGAYMVMSRLPYEDSGSLRNAPEYTVKCSEKTVPLKN